jgi:hypothetical protein
MGKKKKRGVSSKRSLTLETQSAAAQARLEAARVAAQHARVEAAKAKEAAKAERAAAKKQPPTAPVVSFKFKKNSEKGHCDVLGCSKKARTARGRRCEAHYKAVRKEQMAYHQWTFRQRIKEGKAGHHVAYTKNGVTKPTRWAKENTRKAVAQAKRRRFVHRGPSDKELERILIETKARKIRIRKKKQAAEAVA